MNVRKRFLIATVCLAFLVVIAPGGEQSAVADPVSGQVFSLRQPDGTTLQVRLWGDEFYHVAETLEGYTIVAAPDGRGAHYAKLSDDGDELLSAGVPVGQPIPAALNLPRHLRISKSAAVAKAAAVRARFAQAEAQVLAAAGVAAPAGPQTIGNVQGIVLLVDFSDDQATIPPSAIDSFCNQVGYSGYGNNGSVRDYFYDVSNSLLTYTNFVPTAYHRASQPRSYYEDLNIPFGVRAQELMLEALNALNNSGFNFSLYDSNADGYVDATNMFYAGERGAVWAEGLWPHSSSISFSADGVSTLGYQMTNIGSSLALRTFCHENGHMVCLWPDLYDYGYESTGAGEYCLMAFSTSDTNPDEPCAYMKYRANWANTIVLSSPQMGVVAPLSDNIIYKFNHPTNSNEYYLIENRQKTGRDSGLPDAGLAIWHIDELGSNSYEQMTPLEHYEATLVQADGRWDLEHGANFGDTTDLWAAPNYHEIGPWTTPSTPWWSGDNSGLMITQISPIAADMTFTFGVGPATQPPLVAPAPYDRRKNRYLSFTPNNGTTVVAFRVVRAGASGGSCWVQVPGQNPFQGGNVNNADANTALCGTDPVFRVWSEPVIHVGDCEITPVADYTIFTSSAGPIENPTGLAVPTILLPSGGKLWGDNVGSNNGSEWTPPNQITNVNDVTSLLAFIGGAAIRPHITVANLQAISSSDPCLNAQVNASDVLIAVQAVAGNSYGPASTTKPTTFAGCAVAPSGGCPCCGN